MLSILSLQSAAYVAKVAVPSPLLRARRSVMMLDPPTGVQHLSSLLAEGAETIGPVLIAQMGVSGGMCAGGPRHCSDAGRHTHAAAPVQVRRWHRPSLWRLRRGRRAGGARQRRGRGRHLPGLAAAIPGCAPLRPTAPRTPTAPLGPTIRSVRSRRRRFGSSSAVLRLARPTRPAHLPGPRVRSARAQATRTSAARRSGRSCPSSSCTSPTSSRSAMCSPTRWLGLGVGGGLALALPLALAMREKGGRVLLTLPLALARWTRAGRVRLLRARTRSCAPPSVLSLTLT